jgi:hypothetical protein
MLALMSEAINPHQLEVTTAALKGVQDTIKQLTAVNKPDFLKSDIISELRHIIRRNRDCNVFTKAQVLESFTYFARKPEDLDMIDEIFDDLIKPLFDLMYIEMLETGKWRVDNADAAVSLLLRMGR